MLLTHTICNLQISPVHPQRLLAAQLHSVRAGLQQADQPQEPPVPPHWGEAAQVRALRQGLRPGQQPQGPRQDARGQRRRRGDRGHGQAEAWPAQGTFCS